MPRINIEEKWWTDPRRSKLARLLNSEELADGVAIKAWKLAFQYYGRGKGLVPRPMFECLAHFEKLLEVGLAEETENGVYCRGSHESFQSWLDAQQQRIEAGKKSAQVRQKKYGTAQPKPGNNRVNQLKNPERRSNDRRTNSNGARTSYSYSSSSSKNKENLSEGQILTNSPNEGSLSNSVSDLIAVYVTGWQAKYGADKRPDLSGRTVGAMKRYLAETKLDEAKKLLDRYFASSDPWFARQGHDWQTFVASQTKLIAAASDATKAYDWAAVFKNFPEENA